jgi:hypothetical protein
MDGHEIDEGLQVLLQECGLAAGCGLVLNNYNGPAKG